MGVFTKGYNKIYKYEGDWEEDMRQGKGLLKEAFGNFEGTWLNNMVHMQ